MGARAGSSPDNAETVPVLPDGSGSANTTERYTHRNQCPNAPQVRPPTRNLVDRGRVASQTEAGVPVEGTSGSENVAGPGGHSESLRRSYGEDAGVKLGTDPVNRLNSERGNPAAGPC